MGETRKMQTSENVGHSSVTNKFGREWTRAEERLGKREKSKGVKESPVKVI